MEQHQQVLQFLMTRFFLRDDKTQDSSSSLSDSIQCQAIEKQHFSLQGHTKNFEIVASNIIHYYCEVALIEASSLKLRTTDISKM